MLTGEQGYLGRCLSQVLNRQGYRVLPLADRLEQILPDSLDADAVIHCAVLRESQGHPSEAVRRVNLDGTRQLLKGLRRKIPFVYLSSRLVYGTHQQPALGLVTPEPDTFFGQSKLAAEELIRQSGHPFLILRSSALFGAGVQGCGRTLVDKAWQHLARGQTVTVYTPDTERDYLYVWDLAAGIAKLLNQPGLWPSCFDVAGPRRSVQGLITALLSGYLQRHQAPPPIVYCPGQGQATAYPALDTRTWWMLADPPTPDTRVCERLWESQP